MPENRAQRIAELRATVAKRRSTIHTLKFGERHLPPPKREEFAAKIRDFEHEVRQLEEELRELHVQQIRQELDYGRSGS